MRRMSAAPLLPKVPNMPSVGDEDDVDDGVGFLGGFDGGFEGLLRALVAAVGEHDEDLAAGFLAEFVVGGEVDGVEEEGAAGGAVAQ